MSVPHPHGDDVETPAPVPTPSAAARSSWKRAVPSPWLDCARCGWRHYPDVAQRRGPQLPSACTNCGSRLEPSAPSRSAP